MGFADLSGNFGHLATHFGNLSRPFLVVAKAFGHLLERFGNVAVVYAVASVITGNVRAQHAGWLLVIRPTMAERCYRSETRGSILHARRFICQVGCECQQVSFGPRLSVRRSCIHRLIIPLFQVSIGPWRLLVLSLRIKLLLLSLSFIAFISIVGMFR